MMLEVRNDDWTPDKIQSYLDLIDHMIDDRLHMCNDNMEQFVRHIFMKDAQLEPVRGYDPTLLVYDIKKQRLLCDLQTCIHI